MFIILFVTRCFSTVDLSSRDLDDSIDGFSVISIRIVTQDKKVQALLRDDLNQAANWAKL